MKDRYRNYEYEIIDRETGNQVLLLMSDRTVADLRYFYRSDNPVAVIIRLLDLDKEVARKYELKFVREIIDRPYGWA